MMQLTYLWHFLFSSILRQKINWKYCLYNDKYLRFVGERVKRTSTGTPIKRDLLAVYRNCKTPSCLSGGFHVKMFTKLPIPWGLLCKGLPIWRGRKLSFNILLEPYQWDLDKLRILYSSVSHKAKQYHLLSDLKLEPTYNPAFFFSFIRIYNKPETQKRL